MHVIPLIRARTLLKDDEVEGVAPPPEAGRSEWENGGFWG